MWLVKIGDNGIYNVVLIAGSDYYLRGCLYGLVSCAVHPFKDGGKCLCGRERLRIVVWHPLGDVKVVGSRIGVEKTTDVVKALQGADGGGAYGYAVATVGEKVLYEGATDAYPLGVHSVAADVLGLDRAEGAGSDMKGDFCKFYATLATFGENALREVESGGGCCDAAFNFGIDCLVGCEVALFRSAVKVRRYGEFAYGVEDVGETDGEIP